MGLLDTILGSFLGGGSTSSSPLGSILGQLIGNNGAGLTNILDSLRQSGHGAQVDSWTQPGPNQSIDPAALHNALGHDQVNQWSQQTGLPTGDILSQLSQMIPHAAEHMATNPAETSGTSAFDGPGMP